MRKLMLALAATVAFAGSAFADPVRISDTYVKAVENAKANFSKDGRINEEDIKTPLAVLKSFNEKVAAAEIDLTKSYTNEFVGKVPNVAAN